MKGGTSFLLLFLFLLLLQPAVAYDQNSTHPSLTQEMIEFFNGRNSKSNYELSFDEARWLKQGSVEEDEPARWINHFYDPVHGVGWSGKHFGRLSIEEGYKTGGDIAPRRSLPSVDWVTNQDYQSAYGRQFGNQTWQKAIRSYLDGDKKSAFIALGHVLHLVEDATVPDHVRDDSHAGIEGDPGSPHEAFSKVQTDSGQLNTAEGLLKSNANFKKLSSINKTIKDLAVYVNQNFFSEDTISNEDFAEPFNSSKEIKIELDGKSVKFLVKNNIKIARLTTEDVVTGKKRFTTNDTINILPSYRDHLFPEAVLTGASVINLFFEEVEKYKLSPELLEPIVPDSNSSFISALQQFPKRTVIKACSISESTCKSMYNSLDSIASSVKNAPQSISSAVSGVVNNIFDSAKSKLGLASNQASSQNNRQLTDLNPSVVPITSYLELPKPAVVNVVAPKIPVVKTVVPKVFPILPVSNLVPVQNIPEPINNFVSPTPAKFVYGGSSPSNSSGITNDTAQESSIVPPLLVENPTSTSSSTTTPEIFIPTTTTTTTTEVVPTTSVEVIIDTTSPSIPVLNFANQPGVSSTNILINMTSADLLSPPVYFDLEVFATSTIGWQSLVTSTVSSTFNFSGLHGQAYYFRARAADAVGNISQWSPTSSPVFVNWSGEVVINEVAWAGTSAGYANDEWFELKNNTDQSLDFTGWKVLVGGKEISFTKINNKIIPANGYYLFERTTDDTVLQISADVVYSLSGGFNNSGAKIELIKPNGEKSDEVNASNGWFAGDTVLYKSMERINSLVSGNNPGNWQSNQGFRETGRGYLGSPIYGSPKRSNFGFIALNFNQDDTVRTLTKTNSPYILQSYTVPAGKTLLIEPGVVIKSGYNVASINVFGSLRANGSAEEKIIFTSGRDKSLLGSLENTTVGSWNSPTSSPQDWQGLWFHPSSTVVLDNVVLRYAGKSFIAPPDSIPVSQAVRLDGASTTILSSDFSDNGLLALFEKNSTTTIKNTNFFNGDRAIQSESSGLSISDSSFNNFVNNLGPLLIKDNWPSLKRTHYTNNVLNMPFLGVVSINEPSVSIDEDENVVVNVLRVSPSSTLNIEQGASLYVPIYGIIEVKGSLNAKGTSDKPINFLPSPGTPAWGNIRFYNSNSNLNYVNFKRGNVLNGRPENLNGMIIANDSNITINNSNLSDSEANSIQANNSTMQISNTNISVTAKNNNTRGIKAMGGSVNLNNVNFNNLYIGMESGSSDLSALVVDMQNMASSSFSNVDYFWQPLNLWSFQPPTL